MKLRQRKRAEDPVTSHSRGAHLIKANRARGQCKQSPTWGYIPEQAVMQRDRPNIVTGTRAGSRK